MIQGSGRFSRELERMEIWRLSIIFTNLLYYLVSLNTLILIFIIIYKHSIKTPHLITSSPPSSMMQFQLFQPSWQYHNNPMESHLEKSFLHGLEMDVHMDDWKLSSSFNPNEDSCDVSSVLCFPNMTPEEIPNSLPCFSEDEPLVKPVEQYFGNVEELGSLSYDQSMSDDTHEDVLGWIDQGSENNNIPLAENFVDEEFQGCVSSSISPDITSSQSALILPTEDMEVDSQLSIYHLLKAYTEAMENEQSELAEVISSRLKEMVSPTGLTMERLAYYLIEDRQGDYLKNESIKNYEAAFRAFYEIFPYGRLAHLTANMEILEAIPEEAETIHIVEFDLKEGVQWPSLIEAMGQQRALRLTSIKWKQDPEFGPQWTIEDTKRRLCNHAQSFGVKLEMKEMEMEELVSEITKRKNAYREKEWLAFNCMVGIPHMGRHRSGCQLSEFLKAAKALINLSTSSTSKRGIITLADGNGSNETTRNFDGCLQRLHALFELMEWRLPSRLTEARTVMECLFLAPSVSSLLSLGDLEENMESNSLELGYGLDFCRFSKENMEQVMETVKEGGALYGVSVGGVNENVISLHWKGIPLVTVSSWK